MKIKTLTVCEWKGPHCDSRKITAPRWEEVSEAIRRLNNSQFNDVYLNRDDDPEHFWLCVGGGAGRYIVTGVAEENRFPTLVTRGATGDGKEELLVGGQTGLYRSSWIQNLETALQAARHFYEHGDFGGDLNWENV